MTPPSPPDRDDADAVSRHVVIESANGTSIVACPRPSVISAGRHSSVSGKYSRRRVGSAAESDWGAPPGGAPGASAFFSIGPDRASMGGGIGAAGGGIAARLKRITPPSPPRPPPARGTTSPSRSKPRRRARAATLRP